MKLHEQKADLTVDGVRGGDDFWGARANFQVGWKCSVFRLYWWLHDCMCLSKLTERYSQKGDFYCMWSVSHSVVSDSEQPIDGSPPGSSVDGILQARILEWVAIPFSRGSSGLREGLTGFPVLQADSLRSEALGDVIFTVCKLYLNKPDPPHKWLTSS